MNVTVAMTVGFRPQYLRRTLESWSRAVFAPDVRWLFGVEPGPQAAEQCRLIGEFLVKVDAKADVVVHERKKGVLENPFWCLDRAFSDGADFVVLAEEDIVVADDVLEWQVECERAFRSERVLGCLAHSYSESGPEDGVKLTQHFDPWVWGTWRHRWSTVIRDSWDHDYSTFDDVPGHHAGWDWNLQRITRAGSWAWVVPFQSRSQNIGKHLGVHAVPEDFDETQVPFAETHTPGRVVLWP